MHGSLGPRAAWRGACFMWCLVSFLLWPYTFQCWQRLSRREYSQLLPRQSIMSPSTGVEAGLPLSGDGYDVELASDGVRSEPIVGKLPCL